MKYENDGVLIEAENIEIGKDVKFGRNVVVKVRENFKIGDYSRLGNNCHIEGRSVSIGSHLWNSSGLRIGLNRYTYPNAYFSIGDRCTIHDNKIDLARSVEIGNDVGLSEEVVIYTHGYWASVLEGYPAKFDPVLIGNNVIIGYRSLLLGGAIISDNCVIGAHSVVTKKLESGYIYAGNPVKKVREIFHKPPEEQAQIVSSIIEEYRKHLRYRKIEDSLSLIFPIALFAGCQFNFLTLKMEGEEDELTDDFRDFVFKYGIRFYSQRPFKRLNFQ